MATIEEFEARIVYLVDNDMIDGTCPFERTAGAAVEISPECMTYERCINCRWFEDFDDVHGWSIR
jgi:hypothetical protein